MGARREQVILGAVAAAVLVAIVVFAAAGGGVRIATPTPTPTPRPSAEADRELFGGSLEPGVRYRTRAFVPTLSFKVADTEWLVDDATQVSDLTLDRRRRTAQRGSERPPRSFLAFARIPEVINPRTGRAEAAPFDLHAWLRRHPDLRVGRATPVTVNGVPGVSFDVAVHFTRPTVADPACRPLLVACTLIAPAASFPDGTQMRIIVLATEPDPLVIDIAGATIRDLEAVEGPAAQVLTTLRVGVR